MKFLLEFINLCAIPTAFKASCMRGCRQKLYRVYWPFVPDLFPNTLLGAEYHQNMRVGLDLLPEGTVASAGGTVASSAGGAVASPGGTAGGITVGCNLSQKFAGMVAEQSRLLVAAK